MLGYRQYMSIFKSLCFLVLLDQFSAVLINADKSCSVLKENNLGSRIWLMTLKPDQTATFHSGQYFMNKKGRKTAACILAMLLD